METTSIQRRINDYTIRCWDKTIGIDEFVRLTSRVRNSIFVGLPIFIPDSIARLIVIQSTTSSVSFVRYTEKRKDEKLQELVGLCVANNIIREMFKQPPFPVL